VSWTRTGGVRPGGWSLAIGANRHCPTGQGRWSISVLSSHSLPSSRSPRGGNKRSRSRVIASIDAFIHRHKSVCKHAGSVFSGHFQQPIMGTSVMLSPLRAVALIRTSSFRTIAPVRTMATTVVETATTPTAPPRLVLRPPVSSSGNNVSATAPTPKFTAYMSSIRGELPLFPYADALQKGPFGDFRDDLARDGVAVIKGAIPRDRAVGYRDAALKWLEAWPFGFKLDDPSTWNNDHLPIQQPNRSVHRTTVDHVFHLQP
jgi:hypothetical protein